MLTKIPYSLLLLFAFSIPLFISCSETILENNRDVVLVDADVCNEDESELNYPFLVFDSLGVNQSMVFYEGKALFINQIGNKLKAHIYWIDGNTSPDSVELRVDDGFMPPHANVSCLGGEKVSASSIFPALYVSSWDYGRQAFVYDIFKEETIKSSLIQIIDPSNVDTSIIGAGHLDWVVDDQSGYLYSVAYHINGSTRIIENNYTHITRFLLPPLEDYIINLSDDDIIDYFTVPIISVSQDKYYRNGHIYVAAGVSLDDKYYPPLLFDINTQSKTMSTTLIPLNGEPEGFCYYGGHKWLNLYGSHIVFNLDNYLNLNI